jgi:cobalt-zinc-cadmium efflux system outer membrane protein
MAAVLSVACEEVKGITAALLLVFAGLRPSAGAETPKSPGFAGVASEPPAPGDGRSWRDEKTNEITFTEFLTQVVSENLDYAAQRYNVSMAKAAITAAKLFQNPTLQLNGARDVTHGGSQRMPDAAGASLTQTIETGGKRKYRVQAARQSHAAAAATLDGFLLNLKLDAAAAFADSLALSRAADQKRESAGYLHQLLSTQRERFHAGDISQADLLQTQVEEQQFSNELLSAEADAEKASLTLSGFLGRDAGHTRLVPKGELAIPAREFDVSVLITAGLRNRGDLVALRHARDAAASKVREEKANRIPNLDVGAGWEHSSSSQNDISPSPAFDSIGLTLSMPIPLWNRNQAGIATAQHAAEQAQKQLEAVELKAEVQVRQGLSAYRNAVERVHSYQSGILKDADAVLEARRFSYQRGQTALLELLDAQRTANEVRFSYNNAVADQAKALIDLQRAAGLCDVQF